MKVLKDRNNGVTVFLVAIFFAVAFTLFFSPVIGCGRWLAPVDARIESFPAFYAGHPNWTNDFFIGWPALADPFVQSFNPFARILPFVPSGWNILVIGSFVAAGTFMYCLSFHLVRSRFAAVVAACIYCMSGFAFMEVRHVTILQGIALLPAMILCVEKCSQLPRPFWIAVGALVIGLDCLAGHIQLLLYGLVFSGYLALWHVLASNNNRLALLKGYFCLFVCGIAIGSLQILPTYELSKLSVRETFPFQNFCTFALSPLQLIGALFPWCLGSPHKTFFSLDYFGHWLLHPLMCYVGILPLFFLPAACGLTAGEPRLRMWLAGALGAGVLSLAGATPVGALFYYIQPFGSMGCHCWIGFITILCIAICTAFAIQAYAGKRLPAAKIALSYAFVAFIFCFALFVLACIGDLLKTQAAYFGVTKISFMPWANPALIAAILIFCLSSLAFYLWVRSPARNFTRLLFLAVLAADLCFQGWFYEWRVDSLPADFLSPPDHALRYSEILRASGQRLLPVRGACGQKDELIPCQSRNWKIPSASGYSPLILKRVNKVLNITEGGFLPEPWTFDGNCRAFDLLSIKYLFTARGDRRLEALKRAGKQAFVHRETAGEAEVWENPTACPRAWLVHEVRLLPDAEVLRTIHSGRLPDGRLFDPMTLAFVCQNEAIPSHVNSVDSRDRVHLLELNDESLTFSVDSAQGGLLITSDYDYPGWTVTVDGRRAQSVRADYLLRAVNLARGSHIVKWSYYPTALPAGMIMAGLAVIWLLVLNMGGRKEVVGGKTERGGPCK